MTRYVRQPNVVARRIAGETVLVPVARRTPDPAHRVADFFVLNGTGEFLWQLLDEPRDPVELAQHLNATYEIDLQQARADVNAFLEELRATGAVGSLEET